MYYALSMLSLSWNSATMCALARVYDTDKKTLATKRLRVFYKKKNITQLQNLYFTAFIMSARLSSPTKTHLYPFFFLSNYNFIIQIQLFFMKLKYAMFYAIINGQTSYFLNISKVQFIS